MKRNLLYILSFAVLSIATASSCSDTKKETAKPKAAAESTAKGALPNYRYIDSDSVLAKYNLSKDFEEQMLRMQAEFDQEARRHESSMRNLQASMQTKMQNNSYTEATYKADQTRLQQMGSAAEQSLGKKQNAIQDAGASAQKVLNDSIQNFLKDYNAVHGYDAIFYKGAAAYIDPRLDITDEVVEGLNARYNKVKK